MHPQTTAAEWKLDYIPRTEMQDFHQRQNRFAFLICHRRYGKTVACIAETIIRALYTKKNNAQYALTSQGGRVELPR